VGLRKDILILHPKSSH